MASPENQHCANCVGTLSFPISLTLILVLIILIVTVTTVTLNTNLITLTLTRERCPRWLFSGTGSGGGNYVRHAAYSRLRTYCS